MAMNFLLLIEPIYTMDLTTIQPRDLDTRLYIITHQYTSQNYT
jgi:hypothetical protein